MGWLSLQIFRLWYCSAEQDIKAMSGEKNVGGVRGTTGSDSNIHVHIGYLTCPNRKQKESNVKCQIQQSDGPVVG